MAVGKNKKLGKGKKGGKKKVVDPMTKKDWYDLKAPSLFTVRRFGKTIVTRTQGTKIAADGLKGRVVEVSLADLNKDEEQAHVNMKLLIEDVQERNCLTSFYGLSFTTDKVKGLVRKWQTLIEAHLDVKTPDGYLVRLFCLAFTKRRQNQIRKTSYAQSSQIRQIRKKMVEIIAREARCSIKELWAKLVPNIIGKLIENECQGIYPLKDCAIRKVKILKRPKFDAAKLLDLHTASAEPTGQKVEREAEAAPAEPAAPEQK